VSRGVNLCGRGNDVNRRSPEQICRDRRAGNTAL